MLIPLAKRIIIQAIKEEKKASIIITKDTAPKSFKVVSIGDEVTKLKVDDVIFIGTYSTSEIAYQDQVYMIVNEDNVIAKVAG